MLLSVLCVGVDVPEVASFSGVMVAVDADREKVLVRGPRWVSFSSGDRQSSRTGQYKERMEAYFW